MLSRSFVLSNLLKVIFEEKIHYSLMEAAGYFKSRPITINYEIKKNIHKRTSLRLSLSINPGWDP